jgi:GNAT superfamily N-acetyltransferase
LASKQSVGDGEAKSDGISGHKIGSCMAGTELELRPATLDDVGLIADLETARTPDDPQGGAMVAHWWTHDFQAKIALRLLAEHDGRASIFITAAHAPWQPSARRFGTVHAAIHPSAWTPSVFRSGITYGESWLRKEDAEISVAKAPADFENELTALAELGYQERRRERFWELDLVARRAQVLEGADRSREQMRREGIRLLTLAQDDDPECLKRVFDLDVESTKDIPTTVPIDMPPFEEWFRSYFDNPGISKDRFWIARVGDEVVGMSVVEYPPERGVPSTEYTGISPRFRGRGIARALKYETVAQAIAVGAKRLRTDNDAENAPILHINEEMGYQPLTPYVELHREL